MHIYECTPTPVMNGLSETIINNMYDIVKEEREKDGEISEKSLIDLKK